MEIVRGRSAGLGAAILQGFNVAISDPTVEFLVNLDADGQHDRRQIGDLLRAHTTSGADITIGSRWTRGGRCYGLSTSRKLLSRCSSVALHFAGVPSHVKDPTTSFRIYSREVIKSISRDLVGFSGFSFFGASIAIANASNYKIIETPIHFRPRLSGQSNLKLGQIKRAIRDLPTIRSVRHMVSTRKSSFFDADHGTAGSNAYNATRELELQANTPTSTRIIVDEIETHLGTKVLEIGAGLGQISSQLLELNHSVVALEPDPQLFKSLRALEKSSSITVFNSTLHGLATGLEGNSFDSVLYVNVLEHIEHDVSELIEASQYLRSGGKIIIFVPALPSLYGTMDAVSGHYRRYRKQELKAIIELAGLHLDDLYHFDPIGVVPYWLLYRIFSRQKLGTGSVVLYDKVIIPLSQLTSRVFHHKGIGKNLIAVASLDRG